MAGNAITMLVASLVAGQFFPLALRAQSPLPGSCDETGSALLRQGQDELKHRSYASAIRLLEQARDACSQRDGIISLTAVPARLLLAQALFLSQRIPDAAKEADLVLQVQPGNSAALKLKANCAYLSGNYPDAKAAFHRALEAHPDDEEAAYMLGRICYQEGEIDSAVQQFERVLKIDPQAYKAWDNLGLCYQALGADDKALRHFLTAIRLVEKDHPEYDWPYANLADLLLKTGKAQMAYNAAAKAAGRNPYSARNFYLGAKALDRLGKVSLSVNWLERAAALDPAYPEPWYLLGRIYKSTGNNAKGDEAFRKFAELKAKSPSIRR